MGSLREVKNRISSVRNTRKITSAMRLVASSKLTKVEGIIESMVPYQHKLDMILGRLLSSAISIESPLTTERDVQKLGIVVVSSNTSLCGAYNVNVIKALAHILDSKKHLAKEDVVLYPIGKKVEEYCKKQGYEVQGGFQNLSEKPTYKAARKLAYELIEKFQNQEVDQVVLIYHHFRSMAVQELCEECFLPLDINKLTPNNAEGKMNYDYLVEPSEEELMADLLPKVLSQKLFTVLVDSSASEHAARSMAMQIATENANELIQDLTTQYNKSRQQAITNELLDIIGGSMR